MTLHVGAAAAAVASIRTHTAQRTGCPEWDAPGIARALEATQGAPGDVLAAASLAASDPKLRTPSPNGFLTHWPKNATAEPRVSHNVPCPDHPDHDMPCPACKARDEADAITPEALARIKAEVLPVFEASSAKYRTPTRVPPPGVTPDLAAVRARIDQENE